MRMESGTPDMRIAVTIIAGVLSVVMALQSGSARVGGWLSRREQPSTGEADWFVALLFLLGAGIAYRVPALAAMMFGLAVAVSLGIAASGEGTLFGLWTLVALILCVLSAVAWRRERRMFRRDLVHRLIDQELVPMESVRSSRGADPTR